MSTSRATEGEQPVEWEGGDPPCWAHLFEDEEPAAPEPAKPTLPASSAPPPTPPDPADRSH
ncbi:MAG TPA: hypothetical protein VII06_43605 [Chloroflexota bacterium]|jgi:hypothetical protein